MARTYEVQSGDTLSGIAQRFYGDPTLFGLIATVNNLADPNLIVPGQKLRIPQLPAHWDVLQGFAPECFCPASAWKWECHMRDSCKARIPTRLVPTCGGNHGGCRFKFDQSMPTAQKVRATGSRRCTGFRRSAAPTVG